MGVEKEEKTLLLTGASRGIGHATVKRFSEAGWRVLTCSRHDFSSECPWPGGKDNHIKIDLASRSDIEEKISIIKEKLPHNKLHALVNNAAISPKNEAGQRYNSVDTECTDWDIVFQVNFFAVIMLTRGLLKELERAKGSIVNVTSIAGNRVHPFAGSAYATSKAALATLSREMAADLGPKGIRVNAIAPGEINTSILSPGTHNIIQHIPMRRLGEVQEVAHTIFFLCADDSSYIHGAEIMINGGQHV